MNVLIFGLLIFFGIHLLPSVPGWREQLLARLGGEKAYKGVYGLIALAGFVLIIIGMGRAPLVELWEPPLWGHYVATALMAPAIFGIVASNMATNISRWTAHPMLWGVTCWSAGHLLANGDLASVTLFGAFLAYSLFDMASANRRGARPQGVPLPLAADMKALAITAVLYAGLAYFHGFIAGVALA